MCGIAGLVSQRRDAAGLQAMLDVQAHRGPDDEGTEFLAAGDGWEVGLGSRRLAILDLSAAGHQPMRAGGDALVYNGECYNFASLREQLGSAGAAFSSRTDTEVVLRLLHASGRRALSRLNAMFALAFWDASESELVLARDRFGIKPLYYRAEPDGSIRFASELKALLSAGVRAEVDPARLPAYLAFGYVPGPDRLVRGVRMVPPGCALVWKAGDVRIERFRDTLPAPDEDVRDTDAAIELRERMRDAVRRQLVADVPVGVFLSGGLDSSSLLALAAGETSAPVHAYTIGFRAEDAGSEQSADDARYARLVASHFGAKLREFEVGPEIAGLLPRVAWHLDEPLGDPAAILTLVISEAAARESTVLLSGQGADELFAGYRVQQYDRFARALAPLPAGARRTAVETADRLAAAARRLPRPGLLLAAHRAAETVLRNAELPEEDRYLAFRSAYHFAGADLAAVLSPELRDVLRAEDPFAFHRSAFRRARPCAFFERMLHVDLLTFLEGQNLMYSDRLSMAASVELRVPYLDDAVADLALSLPRRLKVRGVRGKHVLRLAMDGVVPHAVVRRRKAGFGAPVRRWLAVELREMIRDVLSEESVRRRGLLDPVRVTRLLDEHAGGFRDHTYRLWTLLGLEVWAREVLDRVPGRVVGSARAAR